MTALRQCIESLGLDRRTCGFCVMCDMGYQDRFDNAGPIARKSFVEALANVTEEDFENPNPVLGLIILLNESEFDEFISQFAKRGQVDASLAWAIIRNASRGVRDWFFKRGTAKFQRCFHLHPTITPLLIQSAIRPEHRSEDTLALFDYYESVANEHSVLSDALPLWHEELKHREQERIAQAEKDRLEKLRLEAEKFEWMRKINAITDEGPAAILQTLADASDSETWRFPGYWADMPDYKLRAQNTNLLTQALASLEKHTGDRCWRSFAHKVRSAIQSLMRVIEVDKLDAFPLVERLHTACNSRWSLTYYPVEWAEELLADNAGVSDELQKTMMTKLTRLQQRGPWRNLRQKLLRKQ